MGWMEFVVAMKWPFLIIFLLIVAAVALRSEKVRSAFTTSVQNMSRREGQLTVGPASYAWGSATEDFQAKVESAVQADVTGQVHAALPLPTVGAEGETQTGAEPSAPLPPSLSHEAVETLIRYSAEYGWNMSQLGFPEPPEPEIEWDREGNVTVRFDSSGVALAAALRDARRRGQQSE